MSSDHVQVFLALLIVNNWKVGVRSCLSYSPPGSTNRRHLSPRIRSSVCHCSLGVMDFTIKTVSPQTSLPRPNWRR